MGDAITSGKLTVKHQVTIPRDVRAALGLNAGDRLVFEVADGKAVVSKLEPDDEPSDEAWFRFAVSQMTEWFDPEEDEYWKDL